MSDVKRKYDSTGRQARAAVTRRRVVDAAGELFVEQGYDGTSIRQIAERAEVSPETVYSAFGSKAALLARWVDVSVVGDDEPIPLADRAWVDQLRAEHDPDVRLALFAERGTEITRRAAPAMRVLRAAAQSDPEIAEQLDAGMRGRMADMELFVDLLIGDRGDVGHERREVVEWISAITGDELYTDLTERLGWTLDQYVRWIGSTIRSALNG